MENRVIALLVLLILGVSLQARIRVSDSIHIAKAGTLSTSVPKGKTFRDTVLILTGDLDESDFRYIRAMAGSSGKLTSIDLSGAGVSKITDYALSGCTSLTSVILPKSATTIQYNAFSLCTRLTSITFGDNVSAIGPNVFSGCIALTSMTIPNKVTILSAGTFSGCTSLTSVTLPTGLTTIQSGVFAGCKALREIHCNSKTPPEVADNAFIYVNKSACKLFVPKGSSESYKKPVKWSGFSNIIEE